MKRKFKDFINFLRFRRPIGLKMGKGASIRWPYRLMNRSRISLGDRTIIRESARIEAIQNYGGRQYSPSIEIGDGVYIGSEVYIAAVQRLVIESGCVLSDHVYLSDSAHGYDPSKGPLMQQPLESKGPIHIGPDCFLGYRTFVAPGVRLGRNCIVGAHSVVTRSFPDYSTIAGVPARLIRSHTP